MRGAAAGVLLLALHGAAAQDYVPNGIEHMSDEQIGTLCADRVLGGADKSDLARRGDVVPAATEITDLHVIADKVCQGALKMERLVRFMRAEYNAEQAALNRLLGRLAPGEGYHIVWLRGGRVEHSPRAAIYVRGRAYAAPPTGAEKP